MHLFVLIPRFNNYLPNDLDFRAQQQKKNPPEQKYENKYTNYPLFVNVTS